MDFRNKKLLLILSILCVLSLYISFILYIISFDKSNNNMVSIICNDGKQYNYTIEEYKNLTIVCGMPKNNYNKYKQIDEKIKNDINNKFTLNKK